MDNKTGTHDITHRIHEGICLNCNLYSTGANPPPFQGSEWIVHEVHGEGGTTVNGQKLYWAKVRKLPDEQEKIQHNMITELPTQNDLINWKRLSATPLTIYCHCGRIMNNTSLNNCSNCGDAKLHFYY